MKIKKIDEFHWHEALDRTMVVANQVEEILLNHPIFNLKNTKKEKMLRKRAKLLHEDLIDIYQVIGQIIIENEIKIPKTRHKKKKTN